MPRLSRRQVLIGAGAVAVGGTAWYGRFALGDTFEAHLADRLGLDVQLAGELLATLREQIGTAEYDARAAGFLAATTPPSRWAMPEGARREAVEALLGPLMTMAEGFVTPYVLAGSQTTGRAAPCGGVSRA